jgi:hypothetical protein
MPKNDTIEPIDGSFEENLSHNSGFTMVGICDSIVLVDSQTKTKRQKCQNLLN